MTAYFRQTVADETRGDDRGAEDSVSGPPAAVEAEAARDRYRPKS